MFRQSSLRVMLAAVLASVVMVFLSGAPAPASAGPLAAGTATTATVAHAAPSGTTSSYHIGRPGGTTNFTHDWSWWSGGWTLRFNWAETRIMDNGAEGCAAIAAIVASWSGPIGGVMGAMCGSLWLVAKAYQAVGKCPQLFVPVSLIHTSISAWNCPH